MARRIGRKGAAYGQLNVRAGMIINPGPFIGIIKNNIDPTRAGRLQVYIPELGGANVDEPTNWYTVSYCSPFRGMTIPPKWWGGLPSSDVMKNEYETGMQSYGMWFTPPDIGLKVLCMFANGDPAQGYYIGVLMDSFDSFMTPAIGANDAAGYQWDPATYPQQAALKPFIDNGTGEIPYRLPISESDLKSQGLTTGTAQFADIKRFPHIFQSQRLGSQGLAFDVFRGTTSATSIRETPSQVFGISTPGRTYAFKDKATSKDIIDKLNVNPEDPTALAAIEKLYYRIGGHTIVMDDGNMNGDDQGIRIRTSSGNMILLDDTHEQIYIINSAGTAWIELTKSGRIDIYGANDFSVRSQGNINLHADKDINMHAAGGSINMFASTKIRAESQGQISIHSKSQVNVWGDSQISVGTDGNLILSGKSVASLKSDGKVIIKGSKIMLNSEGGLNAKKPETIQQNDHVEVSPVNQTWWPKGNRFKSVTTIAPAHEPWPTHEAKDAIQSIATKGDAKPTPQPQTYIDSAPSGSISQGDVAEAPAGEAVCGLTEKQTQVLLAELAKRESGGKYNILSPAKGASTGSYAGKYQFGAARLATLGYIKKDFTPTNNNAKAMHNPNNWTGKDGVKSLEDYLNNPGAQEKCMRESLNVSCQYLRKNNAITSSTPQDRIAGLLMVSHLLGDGSAKAYALGQGGGLTQDANGTTAGSYYNSGSGAVKKLAPSGPTSA